MAVKTPPVFHQGLVDIPMLLAQDLDIINPVLNPRLGADDSHASIQLMLRLVLDMVFIIAGLWFFVQIILGGYSYITAAGDKDSVQKARQRIQQSVIGLVIVFAAFAISWIIEQVFGFSIVTFNVPHP